MVKLERFLGAESHPIRNQKQHHLLEVTKHMSRIAIYLLRGSSLHIPWAFPVEQLPFRGAEEGEIVKKVLAATQFSLPLQKPEGLPENIVKSCSCSKAGGTVLEMGFPAPKQWHLTGETSGMFCHLE